MPKKKTDKKERILENTKAAAAGSEERVSTTSKPKTFPIVGIGGSAGSLEALKTFFSEVSENSAMAYIVLVHMSPTQPTMMPALLQKVACIPVSTAKDGEPIEPNRAYVVPSDKELNIYKGKFQLMDILRKGAAHPIDSFLRSLAQDQKRTAAAVILSGTGTDGTLGVKEIKSNDGLVLVQDEQTAAYDGMPKSAISTGLADMVLPPNEMPGKLVQYFTHHKTALDMEDIAAKDDKEGWLYKIFAILRAQIGHDFSAYKANTILRRISRRMGLNQIDSHEKYVSFLRTNPSEVEALFREMLIGVTHFFRDAESFEALKNSILPELLKQMNEGSTFRAWIPGCSTGEEAYSLAIILQECLDKIPKQINFQLFGTDIDSYAINKAREGLFPGSIETDVSAERLQRFFIMEGNFFRIRKKIRDCVVFSVQDVLKDPPFSRLSLLCCRNLLIYLDAKAQKKLLPLFHYTLLPDGILVLGSSETVSGFTNLFETLDKKWKIFRRREVPQALRQIIAFPSGPLTAEQAFGIGPTAPVAQPSKIAQIAQKAILDQFAPTAILIDPQGNILHVQGRTGKYLETPSGPPTHNILNLAREGLRIELSSAIRAAISSDKPVTRQRIAVRTNGDVQMIDLHVCLQRSPKEIAGQFLVVFEDIEAEPIVSGPEQKGQSDAIQESSRIAELERELQKTRESHQTTIEELESSNEELKSTNEEMQSANEELQSTNEELESSKEELQSLNEELQTVNAELESKVAELSAAEDDMNNLLNSTEIATIFVDNDLRIRRFTSEATAIVNLIPSDIGRPLHHVVSNLNYKEMTSDLTEVLKKLTPKKAEVQTEDGKWYNMRVMPYRTMDNRIDGAVLTFASISDQKKTQKMLDDSMHTIEQAWELVRNVFDMNADPMAVLDQEGKMVIANKALTDLLNIDQKNIKGMDIITIEALISEGIELKSNLDTALRQDKDFHTQPFEIKSSAGKQRLAIHGRIIRTDGSYPYRILLHFVKQL